jgi:putative iron-dependent peroxidase
VAGFRPELWREVASDDVSAELKGFTDDLIGIDGFVMPATQHDVVSGASSLRVCDDGVPGVFTARV